MTTPGKTKTTPSVRSTSIEAHNTNNQDDARHSVAAPALDILAANYVPQYQIAANESFAVVHPAPPLPTIDYDAYLATFAGHELVKPCPSVEISHSVLHQPSHNHLSPAHYTSYWCERLRLESSAQEAQYYHLTLFNVKLEKHGVSGSLFKLKVPGLRESTPRLDLADTVIVRPLLAVLHGNIERLVEQWYAQEDFSIISPGFSGQEYHTVVWYVSRRDETIVIKGPPGMNGLSLRCNVLFPVSTSKHEPLLRSVTTAGTTLSSQGSNAWLHAMLFPELSNGAVQDKLSTGVFGLEWFDEGLNFEQKKAVQTVKDNRYGVVPYLVSGPPGTGKTRTLVEMTMQMLTVSMDHSIIPHILVCAPSDAAADILLMRLSKYLSINELLRLNNWTRTSSEVPGEVLPYCYQNADNLFALPDFKKLMAYKVVVTSCRDADMLVHGRLTNDALASLAADMLSSISPSIKTNMSMLVHWTALLLDEAAQATEPEALIPISVVMPSEASVWSKSTTVQVIMAGDEYQLGPRLTPRAFASHSDEALSASLFARLWSRPLYAGHPLARSRGAKPLTASMLPIIRPPFTNLIRNYRSHPAILAIPSTLFYADTLIPERNANSPSITSWPEWSKQDWPVLFHNHSSSDSVANVTEGDGTGAGSLINQAEARIALHYAQSMLQHTTTVGIDVLREKDIIVLSPFRAQVVLLRSLFRAHDLYEVNIGPLEAFQGLEARIVIICTTRTRTARRVDPTTEVQQSHSQRTTPAQGLAQSQAEISLSGGTCNTHPDQILNLGLINEPTRFNVALTRARDGLLVIGHATCLTSTHDPCWTSFLSFCARNKLIRGQKSLDLSMMNAQIAKMSGLEKALRYADFVSTRDRSRGVEEEENSMTQTPKFRLRGQMVGLDEAMSGNSQRGRHTGESMRENTNTSMEYDTDEKRKVYDEEYQHEHRYDYKDQNKEQDEADHKNKNDDNDNDNEDEYEIAHRRKDESLSRTR